MPCTSPGAQIFGKHCGGEPAAEFMLQSQHKLEVLKYSSTRGTEEQVASRVSGDQRSAAPGTADSEFDAGGSVPRMQILIGEGPGFANGAARYRHPIKKRTGRDIEKLPEQDSGS